MSDPDREAPKKSEAKEASPSPNTETKDGDTSASNGGRTVAKDQHAQTALAVSAPPSQAGDRAIDKRRARADDKADEKQSPAQAVALSISRPTSSPAAADASKASQGTRTTTSESNNSTKPAVAAALQNSKQPQVPPPLDATKHPSPLANRTATVPASGKEPTTLRNAGKTSTPPAAPSGAKAAETVAVAAAQQEKLAAFFEQAKTSTAAKSAAQQAQVIAIGSAKYQALRTAIDERARSGASEFAAARANLAAHVGTQQALAISEASQAATRLKEDCTRQQTEVNHVAESESARMVQEANAQAVRINGSVLLTNQSIHAGVNRSLASAEKIEDADDRAEVKQAILRESATAREHIGDQGLTDRDLLLAKANQHAHAMKADAHAIFAERDAKLSETIAAVEGSGTHLAQRFAAQASKQLEDIAKAEKELSQHLSHLETSASDIIKSSNDAAHRIATAGEAQIIALVAAYSKASASIASASASAVSQIERADASTQQLKSANTYAAAELGKLGELHLSEVRRAHSEQMAHLDGLAGRFGSAVDEKAAAVKTKLDGALGKVASALSDGVSTITAQCASERATAQSQYLEAFAQLSSTSWAKVQDARGHWHADADKFASDARHAGDTAIGQHAQALTVLPGKLAEVERATLEKQHASWISRHIGGIWKGIAGFFVALVIGIAAVAFLVTLGIGAIIAIAIVAAIGGLIAIYQRIRTLMAQWGDWSLGAKILGVLGSIFAGIGDTVALTGLLEGVFGTEAVTGRELTGPERDEKITVGILSALTLGISKALARRVGTPSAGEGNTGSPRETKLLTDGSETGTATPKETKLLTDGSEHASKPNEVKISPSDLGAEIVKRNGGSMRKSIAELNSRGLTQSEMLDALESGFKATGRNTAGSIRATDGSLVLLSARIGKGAVNIIRPTGVAEFGMGEIFVDLKSPGGIGVRGVVSEAGDHILMNGEAAPSPKAREGVGEENGATKPEPTLRQEPSTTRQDGPKQEAPEPAAEGSTKDPFQAQGVSREELIENLSRDKDDGFKKTPKAIREAEVAVQLVEKGKLSAKLRRPMRDDGHSGDIIEGDPPGGKDWDIKEPRSRDTLIREMEAALAKQGRPKKLNPNRKVSGEFEIGTEMRTIRNQIASGEGVIIDISGLNPADLATLREAVTNAGLDDQVLYND